MSSPIIKVENLSKQYRLGLVGSKTIKEDLYKTWRFLTGRTNPYLLSGDINDRTQKVDSDYVWALKDINFEINEGEVVGVIGKNGSGKSTLLKLLSSITAPTAGSIKIKGKISSLLEVGTGFHPDLTGRENLYLNGAILGMKKAEIDKKFDEILDFAEVEKYIDTPVKRYSSGMYVRLAFAVAAHLEPDILIVDEVLSVGDAEFQKKCLGKMKDVSSHGRTILFVSHNIPSVQNLCTHGIVLNNGIIESNKTDINTAISNYMSNQAKSSFEKIYNRIDRIGNGKIRFTDYKLLDKSNNDLNIVISGEKVIIRLFYSVNSSELLKNVEFAISISSNLGLYLSDMSNVFLGTYFNIDNKSNYIDCTINKFPFMEGRYFFNIMVNQKDEIYDYLEKAIVLDVDNGDFFNSGHIPDKSHQSFLFDYSFTN